MGWSSYENKISCENSWKSSANQRVVCAQACIARNCYPSPLNYYNFPKSCCTSVNEVICHGIPDRRQLQDGDILNGISIFLLLFNFLTSLAISDRRLFSPEFRPSPRSDQAKFGSNSVLNKASEGGGNRIPRLWKMAPPASWESAGVWPILAPLWIFPLRRRLPAATPLRASDGVVGDESSVAAWYDKTNCFINLLPVGIR